jgi:hypothetical protein
MTEAGSWYLRIEDIAALARWMADHGYSGDRIAYMVENPTAYSREYQIMVDQAEALRERRAARAAEVAL